MKLFLMLILLYTFEACNLDNDSKLKFIYPLLNNNSTENLPVSNNPSSTSSNFTVSGNITGLQGSVLIQNNSSDTLTLSTNGSFTFPTSLNTNSTYNVSISSQPLGELCTVSNGSGTITTANVTNISISCSRNAYRVFVTSTNRNANFGNIAGADTYCNSATNKPTIGNSYKAMIVDNTNRRACTSANCTDSAENIDWVFKPNTAYIRATDGAALFTTNSAGIFSFGTMSNTFDSGSAKEFWTGLRTNWITTSIISNCNNWSTAAAVEEARHGISNSTGVAAISGNLDSRSCNSQLHLLCIEQ